MRKIYVMGLFLSFCISIVFSSSATSFFISEFSLEFYPHIYLTIESGQKMDMTNFQIIDNAMNISTFSFKEQVEMKACPTEILIIVENIKPDSIGEYDIDEDLLHFLQKLMTIHENVKIKVCLLEGSYYRKNTVNFINNFEILLSSIKNYAKPVLLKSTTEDDSTKKTTLDKSILTEIVENEIGSDSEHSFLFYYSNGSDSTLKEEEMNELLELYDFQSFYLTKETLLNNRNDKNELFSTVFDNAHHPYYRYLIGYSSPLNPQYTEAHKISFRYLDQPILEHSYSIQPTEKERFIFNVNTSDYPVISFSCFDEAKKGQNGSYLLYENLKRNDSFERVTNEKKYVDFVFVIEDTYYSKFYYQYLIQRVKTLLMNFNKKGYSVRVAMITYGDKSELVFDLDLNYEKILTKFETFNFSGGHYDFEKALIAVEKAVELDFFQNAIKNIVFVQTSDVYFNDNKIDFDTEKLVNSMLNRNINFFGITNNPFFYDLSYRVPGMVSALDFDLVKLFTYQQEAENLEFFIENSEIGKMSDLLLFDEDSKIYQTAYYLNPRLIIDDFKINSITAVPFIVRMGEVVTLRCDTYPLSGVEFKWFDEDTNNTNFSKGNDLYEVQWIAPMKPGYYSISVQANYYHQSLSGKVVVLVK